MAGFELLNEEIAIKELKRRRVAFRKTMQVRMGLFIDLVRREAADLEMIKNTTGTRNPSVARKKQPATPGRLTNRTGKLKHMLKEDTYGGWSGRGRITYKKDTSALKLLVKVIRVNDVDKGFVATVRVHISSIPSVLSDTGGKGYRMPIESKKTLRMRFNWETRSGKRPYMDPAAKRNLVKMTQWAQVAADRDLGGTI